MKVLDLSMDLAGQYATRLLSRFGFEVTRARLIHPEAQPAMIADGRARIDGSDFDRYLNRGKRNLTIDLAVPNGRASLDRLLLDHRVVLSTFLPEAASRLQTDPDAVHAVSPLTHVVTITPYGSSGRRSALRATEQTLFAHAGAMLVTGDPNGLPLCPNLPIASMLGGIYGAMSVVLAALGRARTSEPMGEVIDLALFELLVANLERVLAWYTYLEAVPLRGVGSGRPEQSAGGGSLRAADGFFYIFSGYQWFDRVAEMVGRPELKRDLEVRDPQIQRDRTEAINREVAEAIAGISVGELSRRALLLRMPSGPVNTMSMLPDDPQMRSRGTFRVLDDGDLEIDEPFRITSASVSPSSGHVPLGPREKSSLPLNGLKVLDMTHAFAGPTCSRLLAEAGADVVKIESVTRLDLLARGMLPLDNDTRGAWWDRSGYFAERNLGKRAVTLDMSKSSGRDLFLRLLSDADVVVSNFTPRVLRDWGLDAEAMLTANPRLIVLLMSGFGQEGPKCDSPALAGTMEAASGFSSLVRIDDDAAPGALGFNFGDMVSGVYGAASVLLAVHRRAEKGVGQVIDFACAEAPLAFLAPQILSTWRDRSEPSVRDDSLHAGTHVLIAAEGECGRQGWVLAYVVDEYRHDFEDFLDEGGWQAERIEGSGDAIPPLIRSSLSRQDVLDILEKRGICSVPLSDAEDLWYDAGLRERSFYFFASRRSVGTLPYARALPLHWGGKPLRGCRHSIPTLGEDNAEILGDSLGIPLDHLAQLEQDEIIGTQPVGHLPKTFAVPLSLAELEKLNLVRPVVEARERLVASFFRETNGEGTSAAIDYAE